MKNKITLLLLFYTLFFNYIIYAQDGSNDPTFNPDDTGYYNGANGYIYTAAPQVDGKIIIAGGFTQYNDISRSKIARINADETLDLSFNPGSGTNDIIKSSIIQSDGKIIIAGDFTEYNGVSKNRIARLNVDGTLDTSFNIGTGADYGINIIVQQADGKILVGGYFENFNGQPASRLLRLNADGTTDASFSVSGVTGGILAIAVQADGKVLVGGNFYYFNGVSKPKLTRLNSDGTQDNSFLIGVGPDQDVQSIAVNNEGKIFVGGMFTHFNQQFKSGIVGLNSDGSINTAFNAVTGASSWIKLIICQTDGKIIIGGFNIFLNNGGEMLSVLRLNTSGTLDSSFESAISDGELYDLKVTPEGKLVVTGNFARYNDVEENFITLRNANGSKDILFDNGHGTGADNSIWSSVVQPDSKIIIGGYFSYYNGMLKNGIARLNVDGSVDETFSTGIGFNGIVALVMLQPNGKIVVGGYFTKYNGQPASHLVRLMPDGTIDTSFHYNIPFETDFVAIEHALIQPDGKIILGEQFIDYSFEFKNICRINPYGDIDTSFNSQALLRQVSDIVLQPDGKIVVAYGTSNLSDNIFIQRLNSDGNIDPSFSTLPATTLNMCYDMILLPDGKLILSGYLYTDGIRHNKVLRINADGTLDNSYPEITFNDNEGIYKLWLQPDGKLLGSGVFTKSGETTAKRIVRFNQDGSLDSTFDVGEGPDATVSTVSFQMDKIIIAGSFNNYDGIGRNRIARLKSSGFLDNDLFIKRDNSIIAYKQNTSLIIDSTKDLASVEVYDIAGRLIAQRKSIRDINTSIDGILSSNSILMIIIKCTDGTKTTKKIYF